jgi:hypothetical protein
MFRQYRQWAEVYAQLIGDRALPLAAAERERLRASGRDALRALLEIVDCHLLSYVAPTAAAEQVQKPLLVGCHASCCYFWP